MTNKSLVIIGSGLGAVSAAVAARSRGALVTVITGRPGATALASGAWDVGPIDDVPEGHPYARLREALAGQSLTLTLEQAFEAMSQHMPYPIEGSFSESMGLLTPLGSLKQTTWADPAQAAGNVFRWKKARLLVAGIPGVAGFAVPLIMKLLQSQQSKLLARHIEGLDSCSLGIEGIPQHSLSPFALAERLEEDDAFDALAKALKKQVQEHNSTHVMLPPVIGVHKSPEMMRRLSKAVGATCFESLSTVPSVPGLRRHHALQTVLEQCGARLVSGWATGYESAGDVVTELIVSNGASDQVIDATHVVLASGRFVSGGIEKSTTMREPLFDLPVFIEKKVVGDTFVGNLVQRNYLDSHKLFTAGLRVDTELRPVNRWGEPVFENLHAVGSVMGGYEAGASGSGSGVAMLSGWVAGLKGAL